MKKNTITPKQDIAPELKRNLIDFPFNPPSRAFRAARKLSTHIQSYNLTQGQLCRYEKKQISGRAKNFPVSRADAPMEFAASAPLPPPLPSPLPPPTPFPLPLLEESFYRREESAGIREDVSKC